MTKQLKQYFVTYIYANGCKLYEIVHDEPENIRHNFLRPQFKGRKLIIVPATKQHHNFMHGA